MASARYRFSSRGAKKILSSPAVQKVVRRQAEKGRAALGGSFAATARVEPTVGWDGRPGYRIAVPASSRVRNPLAAEFGTGRSRGVNRLPAALAAAGRSRGRR